MPTQQQIISAIQQAAGKYHVNPDLMVADARVESGLNPGAVGDGGTSFGLYQHHVNGAGGPTQQSARRFLDWRTSINDTARRFHGAQTPEDIYRAQRPADHAGYVAKLKAAMGGHARLNAPVTGGGVPASQPAGGSGGSDPIIASIFGGLNPVVASLLAEGSAPAPATAAAPGGGAPTPGPRLGGGGYKAISKWGQRMGLVPGSTTGGRHAPGSYHYQGSAVDFGDASSSPAKLLAAFNALAANPAGVKEAFYDPAGRYIKDGVVHQGAFGGHGDHLHVARRAAK